MISNNDKNNYNIYNIEQLKNETIQLFKDGDQKYNYGTSSKQKEEGLTLQIQGLKKLQTWIDSIFSIFRFKGETDVQKQTKLREVYQERYSKVDKALQNKPQEIPTQNQAINQNNGKNQNDESLKLQNTISAAIIVENPNILWDDIGGLENAKNSLKEAVIVPIKFPKLFQGARQPWKGILLYGPPGTGKTYLAKACATEAQCTFISVSAADLVSKYVGETEKTIRALFNLARSKVPSIIFIDECDSMFGERKEDQQDSSKRAITEFLTQMQGVGNDDQGLLVLGATNLPWGLDTAVRRRFEKRIYIPLPDEQSRIIIIQKSLNGIQNNLTEKQIKQIAKDTKGFSGSDIKVLIKDTVMQPVRLMMSTSKFKQINNNGKVMYQPVPDNSKGNDIKVMNYMDIQEDDLQIPHISYKDFENSLKKCKPSVSKNQLKQYDEFTNNFGQDG